MCDLDLWPWPMTFAFDLEPYGDHEPWWLTFNHEPCGFLIKSDLKWRLLPRSRARDRGNNLHLRFDIIEKPHGSWFKVNHHGSWSSIWFKVKWHMPRSKVKVTHYPNLRHSTTVSAIRSACKCELLLCITGSKILISEIIF